LIEKNPTAINIQAIPMIMKPIKIIVRTAPISHNNPAVSKIFSPDFMERLVNDFLKNIAEMMANMNSTTKAVMRVPIIPQRLFMSMKYCWIAVGLVQSISMFEIAMRIITITVAMKATTPIMSVINP